MRRVRGNSRGLSEIVGTLILILIVVAAATALSAFITGYEKTLLAQEASTHEKTLESYKIFSISFPDNKSATAAGPSSAGYLVFDLASTTVEPSSISSITIDNQPVAWYCALPYTAIVSLASSCVNQGGTLVNYTTPLPYSPLQEYKIFVNYDNNTTGGILDSQFLNANSFSYKFPYYNMGALMADPELTAALASALSTTLTISVYTVYDNEFTQTLSVPVAVANVTTLVEPGTASTVVALDGEASIQPGGNDSIVLWWWNATNSTVSTKSWSPAVGEVVPVPSSAYTGTDAGVVYTVTLVVVDEAGLWNNNTITWIT
jgi:flagellin-like protein